MEPAQATQTEANGLDHTVTVSNLHKSYRRYFGSSIQAVKGVSFSVDPGSIVGLIGPNGAGKSTLIRCLLGLLNPDQGSVSIFGQSPGSKQIRKRIGYMSEVFQTYDFLTPVEVLRFFGRLSEMPEAALTPRIEKMLQLVGLEETSDYKVKSFSKGMNQRLGIGQALVHDPELLILDEPFTGLDPQGRRSIIDVLLENKEKGKTIFFSSHVLSDIERLCDEVLMISRGEVVLSGTLDELLDPRRPTLEDLYLDILPSTDTSDK